MKRRLRMGFCWFLVTIAICTALLLICNQSVINNADGRLFDEIETVPEGYFFRTASWHNYADANRP